MLYGEDTAAVRPLNLQKRAAAAEKLRWPQGGPMPFGYILQAVGSPWNYNCVVKHFCISTLAVAIRQAETKELVKEKKKRTHSLPSVWPHDRLRVPPAVALRAP